MRDGIGPAIDQVMTCAPITSSWAWRWRRSPAASPEPRRCRRPSERAGVGVSMGSTAAAAAAFEGQADRRAHAASTKGRPDVRDYLTEAGYDIVRLTGLKCASPRPIAEVAPATPRNIWRDGRRRRRRHRPGRHKPGDGAVAAEAERWLDKPVLSMNAVTYWHALRRFGIEDTSLVTAASSRSSSPFHGDTPSSSPEAARPACPRPCSSFGEFPSPSEGPDGTYQDPRAATFHPPTMEMFAPSGVTADCIDQGIVCRNGSSWPHEAWSPRSTSACSRTRRLILRLQCEQHKLVGILADNLSGHRNSSCTMARLYEGVANRGRMKSRPRRDDF